jgi:hypothetical protein
VRDLICWTLGEFEVCCEPQQPMTNRGIYTAGSSFRILDVREDFLSNSEDAVPHHRERERIQCFEDASSDGECSVRQSGTPKEVSRRLKNRAQLPGFVGLPSGGEVPVCHVQSGEPGPP